MKSSPRKWVFAFLILLAILIIGQGISYLLAPESWQVFLFRLPVILSMIAFWGPIVALLVLLLVAVVFRMLGFSSLEKVREESVEQNNPVPAIVFVGTLIASILFLLLVIRP